MAEAQLDEVWDDWQQAVNMTPKELEDWLATDESKSVGDTGGDDAGRPGTPPAAASCRSCGRRRPT